LIANELENYIIDYSLVEKLSNKQIDLYKIIPINKYNIFILVVFTDDKYLDKKSIENIFNFPIKYKKISKESFSFFYNNIKHKINLNIYEKEAIKYINNTKIEQSKISMFCDELFILAIKLKASDIHIETLQDKLNIRYRINGVMVFIYNTNIQIYSILSSIIKLFASLDISQKRLPQNGEFSRKLQNNFYDFRVSTLPTNTGESIVLRILDNKNANIKLNHIGFESEVYDVIKTNINYSSGLILITGATGSGKTTTLYSMLNSIDKKHKKIITIEDPVEYKIDDITQVNINNDVGLNYSIVLKNVLRQDPDVLMIGEIRDKEALDIAIQAALTGHLVIATLHTSNAVKTINRLFDLGAKPFLIASVLKLIVSQKLYRVLCDNCKEKYTYNNKMIYKAKTCVKCNFSGYVKRNVLAQYLEITNDNYHYIEDISKVHKLKKYTNISSLNKSLYEKVIQGITSLNEYHKNEI
jgi:general secretion pathway protein E